MPVCKWCKEHHETPSGARRIKRGQECARCGMSYTDERAVLAQKENDSLESFTEVADVGKAGGDE